jgi:hypothetical protein
MSVSQAAELAGGSVKTVRNWLSAGRLTRQGVPGRPTVAHTEPSAILTRDKNGVGAPCRPPHGLVGANAMAASLDSHGIEDYGDRSTTSQRWGGAAANGPPRGTG